MHTHNKIHRQIFIFYNIFFNKIKFMMDIAKQVAAETNTKLTCIVGKELEQ